MPLQPPDGSGNGDGNDGPVTPGDVSVIPKVVRVDLGGTVQFLASVEGVDNGRVQWTIQEGATGGSISSSGLYQAPPNSGTFHVIATSVDDNTRSDSATVTVAAPAGTRPVLQAGVWTDLTPVEADTQSTFGAPYMEIDPTDPSVIYLCVDMRGLWKTSDGGSSWTRLGDPNTPAAAGRANYLDSPISVRVDPRNPQRLIATQGVRGNTMGFWVSTNGGESWVRPAGFEAIIPETTSDITALAVDPLDFDHILLASHSNWGSQTPGILESQDGGETWIKHPAQPGWVVSSPGLHFLHAPAQGIGNGQTWLVAHEVGFWRTEDNGATWTKVSDWGVPHGGNDIYYTQSGVLYAGASPYPVRSRDNGVTWEQLTGLPFYYYYAVHGDGNTLYTQIAYTGDNGGRGPQPYMVSPESDGATWTAYQNGQQTFINGPFVMRYDASNGVMYSANWKPGIWALKVLP